jgi:hypothetical protein
VPALVSLTPALAADRLREVAVGTNIDWSHARDGDARYRVGDVELGVQGRPDRDMPDLVTPVVTVRMPGRPPVEVEGSPTSPSFDHRVGVGRWDASRRYVLFQSFTGGAHCCNAIRLVLPEGDRLRVFDLGEWDGGPADELPTDRDGDGAIDFVFADNAFLYAFASYAESFAPPKVMNLVGGELVDVSARPGFRPLFEAAMTEARAGCVTPGGARFEGMSPNGACAAYVAAAARVGRFDEAWAEMLRSYDRDFQWDLPTGCRTPAVPCADGDVIRYADYPEALRRFLIEQGYIAD